MIALVPALVALDTVRSMFPCTHTPLFVFAGSVSDVHVAVPLVAANASQRLFTLSDVRHIISFLDGVQKPVSPKYVEAGFCRLFAQVWVVIAIDVEYTQPL